MPTNSGIKTRREQRAEADLLKQKHRELSQPIHSKLEEIQRVSDSIIRTTIEDYILQYLKAGWFPRRLITITPSLKTWVNEYDIVFGEAIWEGPYDVKITIHTSSDPLSRNYLVVRRGKWTFDPGKKILSDALTPQLKSLGVIEYISD